MDEIVNKIVSKWKEIIESYDIPINSVDYYRMNKHYTGYPQIEYCYKVCINFEFGITGGMSNNFTSGQITSERNKRTRLMEELDKNFIDRFQPELANTTIIGKDYNRGETKFHNSKVDYFTNQGHRIIIQFYPQGFIDELREDKLNQLGII
jgi:hypothetical protein